MKNNQTLSTNSLAPEWIKIKSTPVLFLVAAAAAFVAIIIFFGHSLDLHSLAGFDSNPWQKYFNRSEAISSVFVLTAFMVILVSAILYPEQRANAWKYLYTLPVSRGKIYFSKLFLILLLLVACLLLSILFTYISAQILHLNHPEYEFKFYSPDWTAIFSRHAHSFFALLGVLGFQYFLCLRFRNFLIPLGIGMFGYVSGMIFALSKKAGALYYPYSQPMIVKDYGMMAIEHTQPITEGSWLTNVELYSILTFIFFVTLGYLLERNRNIT